MSARVIRWALAALACVVGCGGEPVEPGQLIPVASITLEPPAPVVGVGATAPLTATPRNAAGDPLPSRDITFASSNPAIATVDADGVVSALTEGTTDITAASEARSAVVTLTVSAVRVASVTVTPAAADLAVGAQLTLVGAAFDAGSAPLPNRVFAWRSSAPGVASASSLGLVRGIAPGTATITGTSEGQSAGAEITVFVPPVATVEISPATGSVGLGDSLQLTATLKDASGNPIGGRPVTWQSSNPARASVSGTGLVRGLAAGEVTITAAAEGKSGTAAITVTLRFSSVSAGRDFTCGVTPTGTAYCWGRNAGGSLGNGSVFNSTTPVAVSLPPTVRLDSISAGQDHACGLSTDGDVYCWGSNAFGQLGSNDLLPRTAPALVVAPLGAAPVSYTNVSAGALFTCARATTDVAYCWGLNDFGQLGNAANAGFTTPNPRPLEVTGGPFALVSAFRGHACAVTGQDFVSCWGDNSSGQLGRGGSPTEGSSVAALIFGSVRYSAVAAGFSHTCGIRLLDGLATCWGSNDAGQLGTGAGGNLLSTVPLAVAGSRAFSTISAGQALTCATTPADQGFCWGSNSFGQLGIDSDVTQPSPPQPRAVAGGLTLRMIDAGYLHACGVTTGNEAYCWGRANDGLNPDANALGFGAPANTRAPVKVAGQ